MRPSQPPCMKCGNCKCSCVVEHESGNDARTGRCGVDLSLSGRPHGPEGHSRRAGVRKQKQENRGPEGGPGPQGPSGLVPRWGGRVGGRWVGGPVGGGRQAGSVGSVDGVMGWLYCCLSLPGWPGMHGIRLFRGVLATKSRLRRAVFVFQTGGPGRQMGRAGVHSPRDQKHSALPAPAYPHPIAAKCPLGCWLS